MWDGGRTRAFLLNGLIVVVVALSLAGASAANIDPGDQGSRYVWAENAGWLNARPATCNDCGVEVASDGLTGYLWGEALGWVSLGCQNTSSCAAVDYGVVNDGTGELRGFAWSENAGWISFSCHDTESCQSGSYGVLIDPFTGSFDGQAWSENVGWISFSSTGPNSFALETSWRCPDPDLDVVCSAIDNCAGLYNRAQADTDADGVGDICDGCPAAPLDDCVPEGSTASEIAAEDGGVIVTPDGTLTLEVPPDALDADATLSVTETTFNDPAANLALATGPGLGNRIAVYELQPDGTTFGTPVVVTVVADVTDFNAQQRGSLDLYLENAAGDLVPIPGSSCVVSGDQATCTAEIEHFSLYAIVAPTDSDGDGVFDLFGDVEDICPGEANVITGFLPPMTGLVPEAEGIVLPDKAFKSNRNIPMKFDYYCGNAPVTDQDVTTAPELLQVWRLGDADPLPLIDPDTGEPSDSGLWFRYSGEHWIYNYDTTGLSAGTYEVIVRMPDGRRFKGGFVLR